jgi:hypothetical protein
MSTYSDDARYWGLTPREYADHLDRLIGYHDRRTAVYHAEAQRWGRIAFRLRVATFVLVGVTLCLIVINHAV